ncbi:MAG TPA: DEAD/DEAH box helicase family protein, partial [Gaiellaceae bacterium]
MAAGTPRAGLYEALLTTKLEQLLSELPGSLVPDLSALADAEAADRISRHVAKAVARAVNALPEEHRAAAATRLAAEVLQRLHDTAAKAGLDEELLLDPPRVLHALTRLMPDGSAERLERPLTPLLDTTVFTNAPGEPRVGHELRAEVQSADSIDVVIAFIRWSGVRPLIEALRRHCSEGRPLRILTTTYTNSTEQRALDELVAAGAQIKVSYDVTSTRLHAKAWLFQRDSGYSTAYIGSSNLTYSAQVTGLEWNVRVAEAGNADAVQKIGAVFESYWQGGDFVLYDPVQFSERTAVQRPELTLLLSPIEVVLRPFQEALLEKVALARHQGHHRNLLVAATGTGKTVMAAVDYSRLRKSLTRDRLLFVAHRAEILEQSLATFRHALRETSFGELWVGSHRPTRFEHVFASIQSLNASGVDNIDIDHFDMVIVDEFHHAAAASYENLLHHLRPSELLGLTATPE